MLYQIETDTAALGTHIVRPPHLIELSEDFSNFGLLDSDSVIFEADVEPPLLWCKCNIDPRHIGAVVLDSVGGEIHQQHFEQRYIYRIWEEST